MRISDLLRSRVVDLDGRELGSVDDVHLVQDGQLLPNFGAALRVAGLVVGRGGLGVRLGYHRAGVRGPWPIKAMFNRVERRARYVSWDQVAAWEEGTVRLSVGADDVRAVVDR